MSRIACLRIPRFQIGVHQKHEPELKSKPFVLLEDSAGGKLNLSRARIAMCSERASKKQLFAGMKFTEARAVCANLVWRQCNKKLCLSEQHKLINNLISCSPRVSAREIGTFVLDAQGMRLMGGENKLCMELLKTASRNGFTDGQVGIADSAFAANIASRFKNRRWHVVPPGFDSKFLSSLPVQHLPLEPDLKDMLLDLGIKSIGEFASIPDETMVNRFGEKILDVKQLALGLDKIQPQLPSVEKKYMTTADMGGPIDGLNQTLFVFKSMFDYLSRQLKDDGVCAEEINVVFLNEDDKFDDRSIQLVRPSNNAKFLLEVVKLSLESRQLMREFTALRLSISRFCPESWEQTQTSKDLTLDLNIDSNESQTLLLQRFVTRLGEDSLVRPVASDQFIPELAGVWAPLLKANESEPSNLENNRIDSIVVNSAYITSNNGEQGLTSGFVLKQNPQPVPVFVELEGGRPAAISYRDRWYRVCQITQPERLSGLWWENQFRKSYYVALLDQTMLLNYDRFTEPLLVSLIYEHDSKIWAIDGIYD